MPSTISATPSFHVRALTETHIISVILARKTEAPYSEEALRVLDQQDWVNLSHGAIEPYCGLISQPFRARGFHSFEYGAISLSTVPISAARHRLVTGLAMDDGARLLWLDAVSLYDLHLHRREAMAWYYLESSILSTWFAILLPLLRL